MFRMTAAAAIASPSVTAKVDALVELAQQEWGLYGVRFEEVMELMNECYIFEPTEYISGKGQAYEVVNAAGTNSGSCKVFAFGQMQFEALTPVCCLCCTTVAQPHRGADDEDVLRGRPRLLALVTSVFSVDMQYIQPPTWDPRLQTDIESHQ
eukprot:4125713-Pyramimonas_sp.AAC.1